MTKTKPSKWYMRPKHFSGALSIDNHSVNVRFTAAIDLSGGLVIKLRTLPYDMTTVFISNYYGDQKAKFWEFRLEGKARDGCALHSSTAEIHKINSWFSDSAPGTMQPLVTCREARITMPKAHEGQPSVKCLLRGFQNIVPLSCESDLGRIDMIGANSLTKDDQISGRIEIQAMSEPVDLTRWRAEVDELFKRIRYVMSFAAGAMLRAPVVEFAHGDQLEINILLEPRFTGGGMRPFLWLDQKAIFSCATRSHFSPGFDVKNLHFAIEWFAMNSLYRESKLISAMTVLENLISSNLRNKDSSLREDSQIKPLREKFRAAIAEESTKWSDSEEERKAARDELEEKLAELNRRSLKQKIDLLAKRWGVSLDGISDKAINEAKRARDHVVHRGAYTRLEGSNAELMDHVRVARELVVRFILTALQFEGKYYSYLSGCAERDFVLGAPDRSC